MSWGTESENQSQLTLGDENKWKIEMARIDTCLKNIKKQHDDLKAKFEYVQQSHSDMKDIEFQRQKLNPLIAELSNYITELDKMVPKSQSNTTTAMRNQVKDVRRKAADLTGIVQRLCSAINSELYSRQLARNKEQSIVNNALSNDNDKIHKDSQMKMSLLENSELLIAKEEQKQSEKITRDIITLESIFVKLSTMVHEQGEMVNKIEADVVDAYVNVTAGEKELGQAVSYKRSAMKKKICIIGIVVVALVIIALIIGLSVGLNK